MNSCTPETVSKLFQSWQDEDRNLRGRIAKLRDWMSEVSQLGIPHFGETAHYLRSLREHLVGHFEHEDVISGQLANCSSAPDDQIIELKSTQSREHEQILVQLDDLVSRLNELEPPFRSWQAAIADVEQLVEALVQHEQHESKTVLSLITGGSDSNESEC